MKYISAVIISTLLATPAIAEIETSILFGSADQEVNIASAGIPTLSGDDSSFGIRLGFPVSENITIEASYQDFGESDTNYIDIFNDTISDTFDTTAFTIGAKGILPLSKSFSLIGRLGFARWDTEITETDSSIPNVSTTVSFSGTDAYYGIGAEYKINSNIFIGLEYSTLEFDYTTVTQTKIDHEIENIALSVGMKF